MPRGRLTTKASLPLLAIAFFLVFLAVYALTAQRSVGWQDSGEFQYRVLVGDYVWHAGIARSHPLYIAGARLFVLPFPEAMRVYAVNLFSGVGMATAAALLLMLVRRLTGNAVAAVAAAMTLGLAQMAWWLGTVAEVYTWSLAFLMAELLCLERVCESAAKNCRPARQWWWCVLAFVNGLHASVHNIAFLSLPVYAAVWAVYHAHTMSTMGRIKNIGLCAAAWLAGAGVLVAMVAEEVVRTHSLAAALKSLLVGTEYGGAVLGTGGANIRLAAANYALAAVSFVSPCWMLTLRSIYGKDERISAETSKGSKTFRMALLGLTVIHALFWVRYFVPDQVTFVLPTLGLGAVWLGLGAARCGRRTVLVLLGVGIVCQTVLPSVLAKIAGGSAARARVLPFRDEARYWLVPWKQNEESARRFVEAVDEQLRKGDALVADTTTVAPLMAAHAADKKTREWRLASPWTGENDVMLCEWAELQRLLLVSPVAGYAPEALLKAFEFEREGVLWRAVERKKP